VIRAIRHTFALMSLLLPCLSTVQADENDWLELDIASAHAAMQAGTLTAEALTQFYLQRIAALDQSLGINAIVALNPQALADARALDEALAAGEPMRPLHGIPLLIKDNVDVAGMATTAGSLALRNNVVAEDAHLVSRLREAGAVILARSNMAEWAFSPSVTESSIAGITRNPYDPQRVPAGSSGGTGAGVALNFAMAGIGTDTGNSIRGPSSHNNLVGIRSSMGLVSRHGVVPLYLRNDVAGPMARSVADAAIILEVIAGPDARDPVTEQALPTMERRYSEALRQQNGLRGSRLGVMRVYTDSLPIDEEVAALFETALQDLEGQGATLVEDFGIEGFSELIQDNWCNTFQHDVDLYLAGQNHAFAYRSLIEVIESGLYLPAIADNLQRMVAIARDPVECGDLYTNPRNIAFREAVLNAMQLHQVDALLFPTWSFAPRMIGDMDSPAGDNSQHISPHTGLPTITVPMGFTAEGLPAGLSLLGPLFSELSLLGLAQGYEQASGHRRAP
jgi:amidase